MQHANLCRHTGDLFSIPCPKSRSNETEFPLCGLPDVAHQASRSDAASPNARPVSWRGCRPTLNVSSGYQSTCFRTCVVPPCLTPFSFPSRAGGPSPTLAPRPPFHSSGPRNGFNSSSSPFALCPSPSPRSLLNFVVAATSILSFILSLPAIHSLANRFRLTLLRAHILTVAIHFLDIKSYRYQR